MNTSNQEYKYLAELKLNYDYDMLLEQARTVDGEPWFDEFGKRNTLDFWRICKVDSGPARELADTLETILGCKVYPRFYITEPDYELPVHKDRGTLCSVNILLSEKWPVTFDDTDHYYECALLNVQENHLVKASTNERIILKLSIKDMSYTDVLTKLLDYDLVL